MYPRFSSLMLMLCASSVLGPAALAQDDAKKVAPDGPTPGAVEVRFTDGSHLRMTIAEEHLELATAHGKLKIAVADVLRLDLATRVPEATQKRIEQSIVDLGSPQIQVREKAADELLALKEKAFPALLKSARDKDTEVAKLARELLVKIRETVPAERLLPRTKDVVYTSDSTIAGKLEVSGFKATTRQFGTVELKFADVAGIHFLGGGGETELKLDGRYALQTEVWLDTRIDVMEHGRLTITATGEIDMYATGGYDGQYVGTPKGKKAWPEGLGGPYEPGTLIGRIGQSGKVFVVKDRFEGVAPASGRLYLRAAGNTYSVQTKGEYTIKISGGVPGEAAPAKPGDPFDGRRFERRQREEPKK